jgi:chitin disaccharide deacetylase
MVIINADDYGRTREETDAIVQCFSAGRITSTTAMVFMADSKRAATVANSIGLEVGLHLNLSQKYTGGPREGSAARSHERVVRFMKSSKYAVLVYQPLLRSAFREVFKSQFDEFVRLFGKLPSHIDGHQHRHISANVLLDEIIPRGQKVRKNFSFVPGQKGLVNRLYRGAVDGWMKKRYTLADYFFALPNCMSVDSLRAALALGREQHVEIMTHPIVPAEFAFLRSDTYRAETEKVRMGGYSSLKS